jgi:predicted metal-dependent hydrolase
MTYEVYYRDIAYPRIDLRRGKVELILPKGEDPQSFYERYRGWIERKTSEIEAFRSRSEHLETVERSRDELKALIATHTERYASLWNVNPSKITIRRMRSKWGSCSPNGTLTFNSLLAHLPDEHVAYIVAHETAHLITPNHSPMFFDMLEEAFEHYQEIEGELFGYWFRLINVH